MNNRILLGFLLILSIGITHLVAQTSQSNLKPNTALITFIDGTLEIQNGKNWTVLKIGDTVPVAATIRLQAKSTAELSMSNGTLYLRKAGIFPLSAISAQSVQKDNALTLIGNKLNLLRTGPNTQNQTSAMGVRADKENSLSAPKTSDGSEDESLTIASTTVLDMINNLIAGSELNQALLIADSYIMSKPKDLSSARILRAQILLKQNKLSLAASDLGRNVISSLDDPEWVNYRILMSSISLQMGEFDEAIRTCDEVLTLRTSSNQLQYFYLVKGLALSAKGKKSEAIELLSKARAIDTESEDGKMANSAILAL